LRDLISLKVGKLHGEGRGKGNLDVAFADGSSIALRVRFWKRKREKGKGGPRPMAASTALSPPHDAGFLGSGHFGRKKGPLTPSFPWLRSFLAPEKRKGGGGAVATLKILVPPFLEGTRPTGKKA